MTFPTEPKNSADIKSNASATFRRAMKPFIFEVTFDEANLDIWAIFKKKCSAGHLFTTITGGQMILRDLEVENSVEIPLLPQLWWTPLRRTLRPRGQGAARAMLGLAIEHARNTGLREVVGAVTSSDLKKSPFLLDWYRREGFVVTEGAPFFLHQAAYTIRMQL